MKAILKTVAVIFGLLLLVLVGLFAYLKFAFDPNDYRERLATVVKEQTGRALVIEGDLRLSVFPWLGVELGAARLGNASGFSEAPFASISSAQVRALLLPMLKGRVEVDKVVLDGLALSLETNAQGLSNWADLAAQDGSAPTAETKPQPADGGAPPVAALVLGGLELRDAQVVWDDRRAGSRIDVTGLNLKTGKLEPGKPFPVELKAALAATEPQLSADIALAGEATLDLAAQRHRLEGLTLDIGASGAGVPGGKAQLSLAADLLADLAAGTANVDGLELSAYGMRLSADVAVSDLDSVPRANGKLALAEFSPRTLTDALGSPLPPTADAAVLGRASLAADFSASPAGANVEQLKLLLDDSTLTGKAGVKNFANPAVSFDLELDQIDLDRYLPPSAKGAGDASAESGGGGAAGPVGPVIPKTVKLDGEFRIGRLTVSKLKMSDIRLPLSVDKGRALLRPAAALYGGKYAGNIAVDGSGKAIGVKIDEKLSGVQIGPLLRDFTGEQEPITGAANIDAQLTTSGQEAPAFKRNLNGTANLRFADGALKGVNVAAMLREAEARLTGKPVPADDAPKQTDFSDLTASVKVTKGVARNDDLSLRSPLLRVKGAGLADLNSEQVDYLVRASVVGTLTGQGGKPLTRLKGVTVPVRVSGKFDNPKYALDTKALLSGSVKQKVEEKKKEIEQKAKDKLKDELQKGLGNLFK